MNFYYRKPSVGLISVLRAKTILRTENQLLSLPNQTYISISIYLYIGFHFSILHQGARATVIIITHTSCHLCKRKGKVKIH